MTLTKLSLAAAVAITVAPSQGLAWEKIDNPYGWDKACDKVNCYTPYTAYQNGHYSYLVCKNPTDRLTYVGAVLKCVPRGHPVD